MVAVNNEYNTRKEDINKIFSLLDSVINHDAILLFPTESNRTQRIMSELTAILKAEFTLVLYNCVESTVSNCIKAVLEAIKNNGCTYNKLTSTLKFTIIRSYWKRLISRVDKIDKPKLIFDAIGVLKNENVIDFSLEDLIACNGQGIFSGSLDVREISKLFQHIGIILTQQCDQLKTIKEKRNKLAHGEVAFNECGRELSIEYLQKAKDDMFAYFDNLINVVNDYIQQEKYKK